MSSFLNTLAGTIYEDFIKDRMPKNTTKKRASDIMKIIVCVLGITSMSLVFVVQHLGGILELTYVLRGTVTGPVLAMFTLGMLIPIINEKGIFYGSIGGTIVMLWLAAGTRYYTLNGQIKNQALPLSGNNCTTNPLSNLTSTSIDGENDNEPFYLYRISFYYYCLIGILATTIVALPVSWFTNKKESVDKNLISPVVHGFLSGNKKTRRDFNDDKELEQLNKH